MPNNNLIVIILFAAVIICFIIQLIYYSTIYNRIHKRSEESRSGKIRFTDELPPVSVIIYAKEEADNIRRYLPAILEQDYPQFEVIVINDGSTDESNDLLTIMEEKYPHLYHSFTPDTSRYISHKKLALTLGIKASKYDWLVFTDANCYPQGKDWLRTMARNFLPGVEVVLGYSGYERVNTWFNKKVTFDNLFCSMRYLGLALAKKPYMGVGRNLAYRKELFFKAKGFSAHLNLSRGEDDLFVNQIAHGKNTRVETDQQAVIRTKHSNRIKEFKEKKTSYIASSKYFRGGQPFLLGFETTTRILFYLAVIVSLVFGIMNHYWLLAAFALLMWGARFFIQMKTINKTSEVLGDNRSYRLLLPLFDLMFPLDTIRNKIYYRRHGIYEFLRK